MEHGEITIYEDVFYEKTPLCKVILLTKRRYTPSYFIKGKKYSNLIFIGRVIKTYSDNIKIDTVKVFSKRIIYKNIDKDTDKDYKKENTNGIVSFYYDDKFLEINGEEIY